MDLREILVSGFSAVVGAILTVIASFLVSLYRTHRRAENYALKTNLESLLSERETITNAHEKIRADLQGQILELRKHLLDLQADNLKYVRENAELRQQVIFLTQENGDLKARLHELEAQVARLTDGRIVPTDTLLGIKDATDSYGTAK